MFSTAKLLYLCTILAQCLTQINIIFNVNNIKNKKNNNNKNDRPNNLYLFKKFFRFLFILFLNFKEDQSIDLFILFSKYFHFISIIIVKNTNKLIINYMFIIIYLNR